MCDFPSGHIEATLTIATNFRLWVSLEHSIIDYRKNIAYWPFNLCVCVLVEPPMDIGCTFFPRTYVATYVGSTWQLPVFPLAANFSTSVFYLYIINL